MPKITLEIENMQMVGDNIFAAQIDGKLVLVIDPNQSIGPSASGKMIGIASTNGFTNLPGALKGNVYIGRKA